jgi:DNA helicase-2/ATP-dependent DNA helicase PcrA
MTFTPTPEQQAIIDAAKSTTDNLLVSALAGAAKTSTLVLIAKALSSTPMLCLAFNKRIAVEMQERLPSNCEAMTLNSLGHKAWEQFIGRRLIVDKDKKYNILTELVKALPAQDQGEAYEYFPETLKALAAGKTCGYIPTGSHSMAKRLMDDDDFFAWLDEVPTKLQEALLKKASLISIDQALQGKIDFDDQILLPTVFPATFPQFPLVLVDEAQDLSALNHATLRKLVRKRIIAVGDACQSIYGFRGAHEESMGLLRETFNMRELVLSISFRCPQNVVKEAQWRAPHMKWPEWAAEGLVEWKNEWDKSTVPQQAAIICRNNAPLFSLAMKLLKNGRRPEIVGNDIGKGLIKIMKKFGDLKMPREEVILAIQEWADKKMKKARNKSLVEDQQACLMIFAEVGSTLGEAIAYADNLFSSQGPIQMMTGHKSKGLEFDTVFILDRDLIRVKEFQQEKNLLYVMQTRAKKELFYVNSGNFYDEASNNGN